MEKAVTLENSWMQRKKQKAYLTYFGKGRVTEEEDDWS